MRVSLYAPSGGSCLRARTLRHTTYQRHTHIGTLSAGTTRRPASREPGTHQRARAHVFSSERWRAGGPAKDDHLAGPQLLDAQPSESAAAPTFDADRFGICGLDELAGIQGRPNARGSAPDSRDSRDCGLWVPPSSRPCARWPRGVGPTCVSSDSDVLAGLCIWRSGMLGGPGRARGCSPQGGPPVGGDLPSY